MFLKLYQPRESQHDPGNCSKRGRLFSKILRATREKNNPPTSVADLLGADPSSRDQPWPKGKGWLYPYLGTKDNPHTAGWVWAVPRLLC